MFNNVGYQWKPTGKKFTLGEQCPLTRLTKSKGVPLQKPDHVVHIILWYLNAGCSKHMTRNHSRLMHFVKKFIETVRFDNDHFGAIMGYEDYMIGDCVISMNGIVKRRNQTLVEAARIMLIFSKALMFLWAEAIATACYTQNRSLIHTRHNKTVDPTLIDLTP
nr:putative ribonuclease H-like domain-containing protein [Tanacetum cinerariifolium]